MPIKEANGIWKLAKDIKGNYKPPSRTGLTIELTKVEVKDVPTWTMKVANEVMGFCVAYRATQNCFDRDGLDRAYAHATSVDGAGYIGIWLDTNDPELRLYFDSIRVFNTEQAAVDFAVKNKQLAIYDLTKQQVIRTGPTLVKDTVPITLYKQMMRLRYLLD